MIVDPHTSLRDLAKLIAIIIDPLEDDHTGSADELRALARLEEACSLSAADFLTGVLYLANRTCVRKQHQVRRDIHFGWLDAAPQGLVIRYTVTPEIVRLWKFLGEALQYESALLSNLYYSEAEVLQQWADYRDRYRLNHR